MSCVTNSATRDIVIEALIIPIVDQLDVTFNGDIERPITGHSQYGLEPLLNMGMIYHNGESYGLWYMGELDFISQAGKLEHELRKNGYILLETLMKNNIRRMVFLSMKLTMQVVLRTKVTPKPPYLSGNRAIKSISGSMGMDALQNRVSEIRTTKARKGTKKTNGLTSTTM